MRVFRDRGHLVPVHSGRWDGRVCGRATSAALPGVLGTHRPDENQLGDVSEQESDRPVQEIPRPATGRVHRPDPLLVAVTLLTLGDRGAPSYLSMPVTTSSSTRFANNGNRGRCVSASTLRSASSRYSGPAPIGDHTPPTRPDDNTPQIMGDRGSNPAGPGRPPPSSMTAERLTKKVTCRLDTPAPFTRSTTRTRTLARRRAEPRPDRAGRPY